MTKKACSNESAIAAAISRAQALALDSNADTIAKGSGCRACLAIATGFVLQGDKPPRMRLIAVSLMIFWPERFVQRLGEKHRQCFRGEKLPFSVCLGE